MNRRGFLAASAVVVQGAGQPRPNFAPMDDGGYRRVVRPPKPGAAPVLDQAGQDELEHGLRCMCGCTLSVYICRTTDFTCQMSPAMHRDVLALAAGGYTAGEIRAAFIEVHGERVLMAPLKQGFNWAGYIVPFVAFAIGILVATLLLRRWTRRAAVAAGAADAAGPSRTEPIDATPDELARLRAAIRNDQDGEA